MSLEQLPVEVFEVLFSFLTQEHHGRLYSTGNLTIRHRVLTTPRTCSRSPFSEGEDFAMDIMLATASIVRTNGLFINRIIDMDTKPVNIMSLTITECFYVAAEREPRVVDLSGLHKMHTFVHSMNWCTDTFILPQSITRAAVKTPTGRPITDLAGLNSLTSLDVSFTTKEAEQVFFSDVVWPESLTALSLTTMTPEMLEKCLHLLPSTLTHVSLGGYFTTVYPLVIPTSWTSLVSLKIAIPVVMFDEELVLPPSLTRLRLRRIAFAPGPKPVSKSFAVIPASVTRFSISEFHATIADMDDLADAYRQLLPRLGYEDVESAIISCMHHMSGNYIQVVSLFQEALLRFGLDYRYFSLLVKMDGMSLADKFGEIYDLNLPDHYVATYAKYHTPSSSPIEIVCGNDDSFIRADWAFERLGFRRLKIIMKSDAAQLLELPGNICASIEALTINLLDGPTPFSRLFCKPMPNLVSITLYYVDSHKSMVGALMALHANRHNFPKLICLSSHSTYDWISDRLIEMLADMKLYRQAYGDRFCYAVSLPRRVLERYPLLARRAHVK